VIGAVFFVAGKKDRRQPVAWDSAPHEDVHNVVIPRLLKILRIKLIDSSDDKGFSVVAALEFIRSQSEYLRGHPSIDYQYATWHPLGDGKKRVQSIDSGNKGQYGNCEDSKFPPPGQSPA
jgi:hypothetical protein